MYSLFPSCLQSQASLSSLPLPSQENSDVSQTSHKPKTRLLKKLIRKSGVPKRNYMKFCPTKLDELNTIYEKNHYPSKDEMQNIAFDFEEKISKIENWFKHKRRKEVQFGLMKFEKKKVFTKEEIQALMQEFLQNKNPNSQKYQEIANKLDCQVKHVKNWFSYKRKILLKLARNPKLSLKPKQEMILDKLLDETTSKLRKATAKLEKTTEKLEKTIAKIEHNEEKSRIVIKIEEEVKKNSEKTPNNCNEGHGNCHERQEHINGQENLKNWMASQQLLQFAWIGQMNQNYMQMCQNWVNFNRVRGMFVPKTDGFYEKKV